MKFPFLKQYIRRYRHKRILKTIDIPQTGKILDLSCADGTFIQRLHSIAPQTKLFGIDIAMDDIVKARQDFPFAEFKNESVDALSFTDSTFDVVFSNISLHHYENPIGFFKEVYRILKPNGVFYLTDLIPRYTWVQRIYNWKGCPEPYHFEKFYSIKDLETILHPIGFYIIKNEKVSRIPRIRIVTIKKL